MDLYLVIRTLHIISATILFGTGIGIAFFMFCSRFTPHIHEKYFAARFTVLADLIFTTPAVIIQPLTGFWLIAEAGYDPTDLWLVATYALYAVAGACWLPVVWLQIRMRNILAQCIKTSCDLPDDFDKSLRLWFLLGWPAFGGLIAVFFLMVFKPV
ncbi:MAG: DUF2269 family protein [Pseudomonadota bacterium]